ncbi:MAG: hypothetical protein CMI00_16670 [Oceanospirillaceae bacterium]|nr:hypothetical protein [Oceanospirillaceae bacterium]|tara:strand:+ start:10914 stop:11786 length:873 start_codon:yes stop_codon:yes gene_type:complete
MSLMESITARVIRLLVKPYLTGKVAVSKQRRHLNLLRFFPGPLGVQQEEVIIGGVPALKLTPAQSQGTMLYLHGGAYCAGSPASHKDMVARLARETRSTVWLIDYRLAPEHPYPAAQDDALAAYRALLSKGESPVVAGDSAGGGLSVSLALRLRDERLPQPPALILFSPWVDLTCSGSTLSSHAGRDPMLNPDWLTTAAGFYAAEAELTTPGISPLFGDFSEFPPVLIQVGSEEILLDDALRLHSRMKEAGVKARLSQFEGLWHVFQIHANLLSRSRRALEEVAGFIRAN